MKSYRSASRSAVSVRMRVAIVAEMWALTVWIGALVAFAFVFAPIAFHLVTNLDVFAALTASVLARLATLGYVCGGIALVAAAVSSIESADRRATAARIALFLLMFGLAFYESARIVPQMSETARSFGGSFSAVAKSDPRRQRYDALHRESSIVYGGIVVLGFIAIGLAALRPQE